MLAAFLKIMLEELGPFSGKIHVVPSVDLGF
jgi:hypothetical protein